MEHDPLADLLSNTPSRLIEPPKNSHSDQSADLPLSEPIPPFLDGAGMAMLLGITANQVREKSRDGLMVKAGRGQYDVRASLINYLARLREHAGRAGRPSEGGDELKAQKIRQARHAADRLELQNAAAKADLVKSIDVERAWASILRDVRSTLLAVPSRVGASLPHLTAHDVAQIDREIKSALESLSNGN